jgi:hypothetical protein
MESILTSIKKMLGITEEYTHFDPDIIMHINTVFADLHLLGVGPEEGFSIEDEKATWDEFISENVKLNAVKTYMHHRVRLLFDPPTSSVVMASIEKQIAKFEWSLNVIAES